jgi:phage terminase large subunit
VDKYLGIEYDLIAIEETTTLSATKYQALRDSNRSSKPGWRPRMYNSTNPGNIGHVWYKQRFVTPHRTGRARWTRFIPATVDDNPHIDPEYTRKLEENVGWRLRAYRYGDWDIAAGQYFSTWREDVHVIAPFLIPVDWPLWAGFDYGFVHPTAIILLTRDGDGHTYVVGEHVQSRWLPARHVDALRALLQRLGRTPDDLWPIVAGSDVFARKGHGPTIAEQYAALGLDLQPAEMDRVNGAARVLALLGDPDGGLAPRLSVFNTCPRVIAQIPAMIHDPRRPEDVLKMDVDEEGNGGDDAYDGLRYGVMVGQPRGTASSVVPGVDAVEEVDRAGGW